MFIEIRSNANIHLNDRPLDQDIILNLNFVSMIKVGEKYLQADGVLSDTPAKTIEFTIEGDTTETLVFTFSKGAEPVFNYVRELFTLKSYKAIRDLKEST